MKSNGVVVLDENPLIERYLVSILARRGYRVVRAHAHKAPELASPGMKVLVVITNKPGALKLVGDDVPMLYLSAMPDPRIAARFPNCRMMSKPFRAAELLDAVAEMTGPKVLAQAV